MRSSVLIKSKDELLQELKDLLDFVVINCESCHTNPSVDYFIHVYLNAKADIECFVNYIFVNHGCKWSAFFFDEFNNKFKEHIGWESAFNIDIRSYFKTDKKVEISF